MPDCDMARINEELQKTLHVEGVRRRLLLLHENTIKKRYQKAVSPWLTIRKVDFSNPKSVLKVVKRETGFYNGAS